MQNRGHGISQSALNVYRNCPYAYRCYKEKKLPLMYNQDVLDSGGLIHDAIDYYYKHYYMTEADAQAILYESYNYLRSHWDILLPVEELHKAYTCLTNHSVWEEKNLLDGIINCPITEAGLANDFFYGIIDYIDVPHNFVLDWKTGKHAMLTQEYKIQAYIYKLLYQDNYKKQLDSLTFFFLYPNEIKKIVFDNPNMKSAIEEVLGIREEMKHDIENYTFLKRPRTDNTCKYCAYRIYCRI